MRTLTDEDMQAIAQQITLLLPHQTHASETVSPGAQGPVIEIQADVSPVEYRPANPLVAAWDRVQTVSMPSGAWREGSKMDLFVRLCYQMDVGSKGAPFYLTHKQVTGLLGRLVAHEHTADGKMVKRVIPVKVMFEILLLNGTLELVSPRAFVRGVNVAHRYRYLGKHYKGKEGEAA